MRQTVITLQKKLGDAVRACVQKYGPEAWYQNTRLRRLVHVTIPNEHARAAAEGILQARRRRLGADCEKPTFPPGWFDGGGNIAERIICSRQYHQQQSKALLLF